MRVIVIFTVLLVGLAWQVVAVAEEAEMLELNMRRRVTDKNTPSAAAPVELSKVRWQSKKTAIIVCDMWDQHWCRGAAERVAELAGPMNQMLQKARAQGLFIIHAPSTCTEFYKDTPQRKLALAAPYSPTTVPLATEQRWGTAWCYPDKPREAELPIDDSDMGCDCAIKCKIDSPWTRQIATIELGPDDAVSDNGQETWNLLQSRGIEQVIICGVHLNMCVLGRPFAIRQLTYLGKPVVLIRDMTDSMYNHEMRPQVNHYAGTDLVVAHVERYWCPSILSSDITGRPPFRFIDDPRAISDSER
jgi:nicotinamidase-related amidase